MAPATDRGVREGVEGAGLALGRAAAGALIFALPMLMTMEMWWLGFYIDRPRLVLLIVLAVPLLTALSYLSGFEETFRWWEDLRDAFVALAVGAAVGGAALVLFGVVTADMSWDEIAGKVAIQMIPAAIGALLARSLLGQGEGVRPEGGYAGELFLMAVGALFLSLNLAPTEEMVLISYKMGVGQELLVAAASLVVMHGFVYAAGFRGSHPHAGSWAFWGLFFRYTVAGYGVVLVVSLYILWTFGRTDGVALHEVLRATVVLAFPAAIGAAGARLIL